MKVAVVASLIISLVILVELLVVSLPTPLLLICAPLAMLILIPATYFNLRNRRNAKKGTDHRDQDSMKRALQILRPIAVLLFLTIWGVGRYRIAGQYSYRSPGVDSFAGSSITRLALHEDGSGQIWKNEGRSSDFRVSISWGSTTDGIDITVPEVAEYKHWPQSLFISPSVHHFKRQGSGLNHVGMKEDGQLKLNGVRNGMAEKRYQFRKSILQL